MCETFPLILASLHDAVSETFETLTFSEISGWKVTDAVPEISPACLGAAITLHQPEHYRFLLLLARDQVREFVETTYGPEFAAFAGESGILQDYVCELVNTIVGRLSSTLTLKSGQIALGLPEAADVTPNMFENYSNCTWIRFFLEGKSAWCIIKKC